MSMDDNVGEQDVTRFSKRRIEGRDSEHVELLGIDEDGYPIYQDRQTGQVFEGRIDEHDRIVPHWGGGRYLEEHESVSDIIQEIEDKVGWSKLTDYAEDLLGESEEES